MRANRLKLTIVAIMAAGHAGFASAAADSYEIATYEAVKLCAVIDAWGSIDDCSRNTGRSPEHSAGRKAVIRMFNARTAFMNNCFSTDRYPADCPYMAEWTFYSGFNRAVEEVWKEMGLK